MESIKAGKREEKKKGGEKKIVKTSCLSPPTLRMTLGFSFRALNRSDMNPLYTDRSCSFGPLSLILEIISAYFSYDLEHAPRNKMQVQDSSLCPKLCLFLVMQNDILFWRVIFMLMSACLGDGWNVWFLRQLTGRGGPRGEQPALKQKFSFGECEKAGLSKTRIH